MKPGKPALTRAYAWMVMLWCGLGLVSCHRKGADKAGDCWRLLEDESLPKWSLADFMDGGTAQIREGEMWLGEGAPMTGMVLRSWTADGMPLIDYSVEYEALRVKGSDFFATLTFPVMDEEHCVSFVLGGWGGKQIGISSIDGLDASMNETSGVMDFEDGKWYAVRVEVRKGLLQVWVDGASVVHVLTQGRILGLRTGIEPCAPFGLASYGTEGRIRNLVVKRLPAETAVSGW